MPDRSVTYEFRGKFDSLRSGLTAAGRSVDDFGHKLTALDKDGERMRRGLTTIGTGAGAVALAATAGLTAVVAVTANFEKSMSKVQAATGESAAGMDKLRDAALQAGADTAFSASQAAEGIEALAKAGISTQDILGGGLTGALDLAAAGELDVANAAEIAATAMSQFGLAGADVPHIADLLAAGAGKAQGSVDDMANALKQSGLIADQVGLSIEETAGALAAFAEKGLLGSDAGTSFKTMLGSLTPNSKEAADLMEELGINAYDAQGNFVGLTEFAGNLKESLSGLTDQQRQAALETIFGSDAVRAAAIIYEDGADGIQSWIDKTNDSGYAAEQAATKLDNLSGDLEALRGSLETALIGAGSSSQGPLRGLVQGITDTVNAVNDLPGPVKAAGTALTGLIGLLGAGVFVGSRVVSGIAATSEALQNMGVKAETADKTTRRLAKGMGAATGVGLFVVGLSNANEALGSFEAAAGGALAGFSVGGPWGAAIGGLGGLMTSLLTDSKDATAGVEEFTAALDEQTGALTENNRALAQKKLQDAGAFDAAKTLGIDLALVTDAALGNADAIAAVNAAMSEYDTLANHVVGGRGATAPVPTDAAAMAAAQDVLSNAIGDTNSVVDQSTTAWQQNQEAAGGASDATQGLSTATAEEGDAAADAAPKVGQLTKAMLDQANAAIGAFDAVTQYRQALKAARQQAEDNNAGIEGNSKKALENRDIISSLATAWNSQSAAVRNNVDKYREARTEFIEVATAMGVPIDKAIELADAMLGIPKKTTVGLDAQDKATAKITAVQRLVDFYGQTKADAQALLKDLASGKIKTVQQLVNKYGLTKAEANALLKDLASGKLRDLLALMNQADARPPVVLTTYIDTIRRNFGSSPVGDSGNPYRKAGGGLLRGPGGPRGDKIPVWASDREYIVKAAAVEKYGVAMFDHINAMRFADGGSVGFQSAIGNGGGNQSLGSMIRERAELRATLRDFRHELKALGKEIRQTQRELNKQNRILDRVTDTMEKERDLRDQLIEQSEQFAQGVQDRLTSGLFSNLPDPSTTQALTPQGLLDSLLGTVRGDTANGSSWLQSLDRIDDFIQGPALQQLLEQSTTEQLGLLAQLSGGQLEQLERALNQRELILSQAGGASADALFAEGIAAQNAIFEAAFEVWSDQKEVTDAMSKDLQAMERRSRKLENQIPRIEEDLEHLAQDIAKALDGNAGNAARKAKHH